MLMAEYRSFSFTKMIGCWSCFGLIRKPRRTRTKRGIKNFLSQGLLTDGETECDEVSYSGDYTSNATSGDDSEPQNLPNRSEDILNFRAENGMICRPFPVKETDKLVRSEVTIMGITFLFLRRFFQFLVAMKHLDYVDLCGYMNDFLVQYW
jgi:[calcium/calmodulin-dependent protein kinase] kinase